METRGIRLWLALTGLIGTDLYPGREQFDRLLLNLLSNALKVTGSGGVQGCR